MPLYIYQLCELKYAPFLLWNFIVERWVIVSHHHADRRSRWTIRTLLSMSILIQFSLPSALLATLRHHRAVSAASLVLGMLAQFCSGQYSTNFQQTRSCISSACFLFQPFEPVGLFSSEMLFLVV